MKDIGEGTPKGARRYQAENREPFETLIVRTGCGGSIRFGEQLFAITRIDTAEMTFDLMPLLALNDCDLIAAAPEMLALLTRAFMALEGHAADWGPTGLVQEDASAGDPAGG